jgi:hypothetical protein
MRCLRLSRGPALPFRLGQVISVALLRDCWPEIKATLPAVARAKIGAALAEEPAPFTPRTAATDAQAAAQQPASGQPEAVAAAAVTAAVTAAIAATGGAAQAQQFADGAAPDREAPTGGARPGRIRKSSVPKRRDQTLAALREWRSGLSHREPRKAQSVSV